MSDKTILLAMSNHKPLYKEGVKDKSEMWKVSWKYKAYSKEHKILWSLWFMVFNVICTIIAND